MIGVTFFGVFFTPVFYKVIRKLTGKFILPEHELAEADRPPPASGEGI
jgi:hypothetical protein